jgi:hypothetical protein
MLKEQVFSLQILWFLPHMVGAVHVYRDSDIMLSVGSNIIKFLPRNLELQGS